MRQNKPLQDRVVLVTGASSGLGEATARACARDGARVALAARREERLRSLADELEAGGAKTLVLPADLRDPESIRAMTEATLERFGRIDVLVANAGVGYTAPVSEMAEEQLRELVEVNLLGVIRGARAVLPSMQTARSGHILAIASVAAGCVMPGSAIYGATKAGVVAFCEGLRREVARDGIAVTVILPGFIESPMTEGHTFPMPPASRVGDTVARLIRRPRRRVVIPPWYAPLMTLNRLAPGLVDAIAQRSRTSSSRRLLSGRRAVITGAAAGIGRATALALAAAGVLVHLVDRDEGGLASLTEAIEAGGSCARSWAADLGRAAEVEPLIGRIEAEAGPIDLLVNVAGIGLHASVLQMTPDDLRRLFEVNFFAAASLCRQALRAMSARCRGHIINVSSASARRGLPNMSAYAATKGALHGFTQALRLEARLHGVAVSEVLPISTRTDFFAAATNRTGRPYHPRGMVQTPECVAERILACARHPVAELHTTPLLRPLFALEALAPNFIERWVAWRYRNEQAE